MTPQGLERLKKDEGLVQWPYNDETGKAIVPAVGNITIGYGRNLNGKGISTEEAEYLLNNDLTTMWSEISNLLPWISTIDPVRQDVVLMVEFNTGDVFEFRNMLAALKINNWIDAANELMNSAAAKELNLRYSRMKNALLTGSWE